MPNSFNTLSTRCKEARSGMSFRSRYSSSRVKIQRTQVVLEKIDEGRAVLGNPRRADEERGFLGGTAERVAPAEQHVRRVQEVGIVRGQAGGGDERGLAVVEHRFHVLRRGLEFGIISRRGEAYRASATQSGWRHRPKPAYAQGHDALPLRSSIVFLASVIGHPEAVRIIPFHAILIFVADRAQIIELRVFDRGGHDERGQSRDLEMPPLATAMSAVEADWKWTGSKS